MKLKYCINDGESVDPLQSDMREKDPETHYEMRKHKGTSYAIAVDTKTDSITVVRVQAGVSA
jgi:hypothetical protein